MQLAVILVRTGGAVIMPKETLHPHWLLYELAARPQSALSERKMVLYCAVESPALAVTMP